MKMMRSITEAEHETRVLAEQLGIQYEFVHHQGSSGATTVEAADVHGETLSNILKCLICINKPTQETVGVIIRGDTKLDFKALQSATKQAKLIMASQDFIYSHIGFEVGGIPPVAVSRCRYAVLCQRVLEQRYVIGAGGHSGCGIKLVPQELTKIHGIIVAVVSKIGVTQGTRAF